MINLFSDQSQSLPYPTIRQAWLIFGVCILGQILAAPIQFVFGEGNSFGLFIMYSLAMAIGLVYAIWMKTKNMVMNRRILDIFQTNKIEFSTYMLVALSIPGLAMISGPLTQLLPMPDLFLEQMDKVLGSFGFMTFLTIAVAAPIFEELIFRGIILEGFLRNMPTKKAILYSAFLFALIHMNPWQFIHTFILGVFIGWVYYRTASIWPCIFIHFVNNGLVFWGGSVSGGMDVSSAPSPSIWAILGAIPLGVLLTYILYQLISENTEKYKIVWQSILDEEE